MVKTYFLLFILLIFCANLYAQKPVIDETAVKNWPRLNDIMDNNIAGQISSDGKFVSYIISTGVGASIYLKSSDGKYQRVFAVKKRPDPFPDAFSADGKWFVSL